MTTLDQNRYLDFSTELRDADKAVRKAMKFPDGLDDNPAQMVVTLIDLSRSAARLAEALATLLAHERDRELTTARITAQLASERDRS